MTGPGYEGQHADTWTNGTLTDLGTGHADLHSGSHATDIDATGTVIGSHYARQ